MDDTNKFEECVSVLSEKNKWLKRHGFLMKRNLRLTMLLKIYCPTGQRKWVKNTHFKVSVICF